MAHLRAKKVRLLVTFYSVSAALLAKKLLPGTPCEIVPVPRNVSSSCGYAIQTSGVSAQYVTSSMNDAHVEWAALYQFESDGNSEHYQLIAQYEAKGE